MIPNSPSECTRRDIVDDGTAPNRNLRSTVNEQAPATCECLVVLDNEAIELGGSAVDCDPSPALSVAALDGQVIDGDFST